MSKFYYCYNTHAKKYLMDRGFRYILVNVNTNSGRKFWMFERTEELSNILDEFYGKSK